MRKMLIFLPCLMFGASAFAGPSTSGAYDQGQIITNNLSALVGVPYVAFADNMREFIPAEYQADAATVFQKHWNSKTGKITFEGLLNVCVAGHITHCQEFPHSSHCAQEGYEIASIGHDTCIKFIQGIIKDARRLNRGKTVEAKPINRATCKKLGGTWQDDGTGQELCLGKDGKHLAFSSSCGDGWGVCVSTFKDIQVQFYTALGLANAWGQRYDLTLTCEQEPETRSNQDYLRCSAGGEAYEFEFDDVEESKDAWLAEGTEQALCTLYDLEYLPSGMSADTMVAPGESWPSACDTTDATVCDLIDKHAQTFGLKVNITNRKGALACVFSSVVGASMSNLRTAYGIDNMVFANTIQVEVTPALIEKIKQYVIAHMSAQNEPLIAFSCNYAPTSILSKIGPFAGTDDVLTCYVNGSPVDFVFDDLSESATYEQDGSMAGISCMIHGGKYDGKHCRSLNREQCALANDSIPGGTHWDQGANACVLNDAKQAQTIRNGISIATGIVVTIGTLGIASAAGAGVTGAYYLVAVVGSVAVDGVFIGLERLHEVNPHHRALSFMGEAQHCNENLCAYRIVNQHFARLNEIVDKLEPDEMSVVAFEMDRMASLLSDAEFSAAIGSSHLNERDIALKVATPAVMMASIFVAPEQAIDDLFKSAPRLLGKFTHWLGHVGATGTHVDDIVSVVSRFNKSAFPRSSSSLNGANYYRIYIDDGDNVADIINELQRRGFYVSAGTEQGGRRFLGASDKDIFISWANSPGNWLIPLSERASQNFDEYLKAFLSGQESVGLPANRLSKQDWDLLNSEIAAHNVELFETTQNGARVMRFRHMDTSGKIANILQPFNKQAFLRRASENSLGHDYYRIVVTNKDDVSAIIAALQKQGYYVSSNMDNSGKYFLAISDKNIFGPWDNAPTNWLRDGVDSVFSRIYDDMPDYVLESKLKYVYENSATHADAVRALKQVNAFDEARATAMANDLADELVSRFATRTDLVDMAKQWKKLERNQRKYLVDQVHELVTTMRRDHVGNTVIIIDDVNVLNGANGVHWDPTSMRPRQFAYSVDAPNFAKMLDTIVHENTHAFQSLSKSSIPRPFIDWAQRYYVQPQQNYKLYFDNVIEVEARHVGGQVSSIVSRRLGFN